MRAPRGYTLVRVASDRESVTFEISVAWWKKLILLARVLRGCRLSFR
jgi:hypothetical protein